MAIASQYVRGKGIVPPKEVLGRTWVESPLYLLAAGYEPAIGVEVGSHDANDVAAPIPTPDLESHNVNNVDATVPTPGLTVT